MTEGDHGTHAALATELKASIGRLRSDVEARSDPVLGEIAHALELLLDLTSHAHDHAMDNRDRIAGLEGDRSERRRAGPSLEGQA